MFCHKCGAQIVEGAAFCQKCGVKLPADNSEQTLPNMADHQAQPDNEPTSVPKKKQGKKLPIILGVLGILVLLFIIIAFFSGNKDAATGGNKNSVDPSGVNLSQSYTNEEEGISFKYPKAFVPISEEEYINRFGDIEDEEYPLVLLANEIDGLPEENSYIMVSKSSEAQGIISRLFIDDEQFASTFDDDVTVKETSITEIDRVSARTITYLTSDGIGYQSYFYAVGSTLYRIDFSWMGESSGNLQRFFDAIIGSYKITPSETANVSETATIADTADKLLYKGIPVDTVMQMTEADVIAAFGKPDVYEFDEYYRGNRMEYESEYLYLYTSPDSIVDCADFPTKDVTLNGQSLNLYFDDLVNLLGDDYSSVGAGGYHWDIGNLSCIFSVSNVDYIASSIEVTQYDTDEPIDNDANLGDDSAEIITTGLPDGFAWVEMPTGKTDEYTTTVSGIIQNASQKTYSYLTISFNLYDSSGNQIGSADATIRDLRAGGTWKFEAVGFVGNAAKFDFSSIDGF